MRNVEELVRYLISKDIKLWNENGKLKYNAPKGIIDEKLLEEIKLNKLELLDYLEINKEEKIEAIFDKKFVDLSFSQSRLWFLDRLEEDSYAYNLPSAVKIEGELNVAALEEALAYILDRHEILRTTFPENNGIPYQKVNPKGKNFFLCVDAIGNDETEKWEYVTKKIDEQVKNPFDLSVGPLYNLQLFKINSTCAVLFMMFHHAILDGWSIEILLKEIKACYLLAVEGTEIKLPRLEIQYSDYSIWHNKWMNSPQAKQQIEFWKEELSNAPDLLQMPLVKPRPAIQTLNGATELFKIDNNLFLKIQKIAADNNCSLFMVMYAVFSVLLYRYSHQEDIIIGTTIANRNRPEIESLLGLFANTILLRADLTGNPTFYNYLMKVKEKTLEVYSNQDIPFEKVVEEVKPERSLSYTPLFQVLFELQYINDEIKEYKDIKMSSIEQKNNSAKFDMNFLLLVKSGELIGELEYNTDLFDRAYILRMIGHFTELLKSISANIDETIDRINYIPVEEKLIIEKWNSTDVNFPTDKIFDELFAANVQKFPYKIAAIENEVTITYKELDKRATQLAAELIKMGARNEKIIAILAERGINFLISILAVFKSGSAYLPLDIYHPASRLSQIIEQSEPILIISEHKFDEVLDDVSKITKQNIPKTIYLDGLLDKELENIIIDKPTTNSESFAYVIFTSGSTGRPKGAIVKQKGMVNHLYSKIKDLNISEDDIIAQNASQCFDISVWQYLAALLVGGTIEIFKDEIAHDAERLLKNVEKKGVTILEIVPSFMSVMIEMIEVKKECDFTKLRWLVPTGEALPPSLAFKWLQYFPAVPLINAYGPTECSDDVTHYPIYSIEDINEYNVPIGKPIGNTKILILDKNKQQVAIGIPGELYVSGVCVGGGYINDKEKTEEAFVESPFNNEEKIYKSGDLARFLPDGNIEFLGRIDSQVKVRGFRIELGEIETELRRYDGIKEAVAILSKEQKEIIGYIVADNNINTNVDEIKGFLRNKLPEYMVPSYIIFLDKLPLTPNGKIDRKALPNSDIRKNETILDLPITETEIKVLDIWKNLLNIKEAGIEQNFFEIGGHSLLATRLVTKLRDTFLVEIALKTIFEKPTIKELSAYIDTLVWLRDSQKSTQTDEMENITI